MPVTALLAVFASFAPRAQDPAPVTTDADGKFSFSFVPPRAFQFTLDATAAGHGGAAWRWGKLEPGKELDLGTVTLEPEGILVGHVLDAEGNLLIEGWNVTAEHNVNARIEGRDSVRSRATIDAATGQFRIEGLPPGVLSVQASNRTLRIPAAKVTTKKGEDTFLELRYSGPDPRRRLVVSIRARRRRRARAQRVPRRDDHAGARWAAARARAGPRRPTARWRRCAGDAR
jgi:hypothetical protein